MLSFHFHVERWRYRSDLGIYVSSDGRLKDKRKKIINQFLNGAGYFSVKIDKVYLVHRIVAETFLTDRAETVDHIDGNKRNNKVSNLRWVSKADNLEAAQQMRRVSEAEKVEQWMSANHYDFSTVKTNFENNVALMACQDNSRIEAGSVSEWWNKYCLINPKSAKSICRQTTAKEVIRRLDIKTTIGSCYLGYKLSRENNKIIGLKID